MTNSLIIGVVIITFSLSEDDLRDFFLQNVSLTTNINSVTTIFGVQYSTNYVAQDIW